MKTKTKLAGEFIKRKTEEFSKSKLIQTKDIGRNGKHFLVREAWTFMTQSNLNEKVFVIERLRRENYEGQLTRQKQWNKGDIEYRIGYYIVGKIGKAKGKWVWGQFCLFIPAKDLTTLFEKAKQEGVIK